MATGIKDIKIQVSENQQIKSAHLSPQPKAKFSLMEALRPEEDCIPCYDENKFNITPDDIVLMAIPTSEPLWLEVIEVCIDQSANFILPDSEMTCKALAETIARENITMVVTLPRLWDKLYHHLARHNGNQPYLRAFVADYDGHLELHCDLEKQAFLRPDMDTAEKTFAEKHIDRLKALNITSDDTLINVLPQEDRQWLEVSDAAILADVNSISLVGEKDVDKIVKLIHQHHGTAVAATAEMWQHIYRVLCTNPQSINKIKGILVTENGEIISDYYPVKENDFFSVSRDADTLGYSRAQ